MKRKNKRSSRPIGLTLALIILVGAATGVAQDFDDRSATARVLTVLSATATQDLDLGQVFSGIPKGMGNDSDDSSAVFTITGEAGAGINIQLLLPEYLALADGSDNIAIIFDNNDCSVDTIGTADPSTVVGAFVNIDPRNISAGVIIGSGGTSKLFLGGKIIPSVNQKAGVYSGDVVLSISYNGN